MGSGKAGSTGPTEGKAEDLTSQSFLLKKIYRNSAKSHYEGIRINDDHQQTRFITVEVECNENLLQGLN